MRTSFVYLFTILLFAFGAVARPQEAWPQFRGPQGAGIADAHGLPAEIETGKDELWKIELPPGHSSPVIAGGHIYLTAERDQKLLTIALEQRNGKLLWERAADHRQLEKIHAIGSHAQSTPATDGSLVVSFFGSCGLFCYDQDGRPVWHKPLGPFRNEFGMGSSPIIVGNHVLLNLDQDTDSCLLVLDKHTGKEIWKADRSEFPRGYATPVVSTVGGRPQAVVAGTLRVIGYDLDTGKEVWTVRGLARIANMTPVVGPDGTIYVATWAPGAEANDRVVLPPFDEMLTLHDRNRNGVLEPEEVTGIEAIKSRFPQIDRDKDGHISRAEYENMREIFTRATNRIVAIKPGAEGDATSTHVLWSYGKLLPYVPSPLLYRGCLYLVKNGGILNCLDAATGKPLKQERLPGPGDYYSSPVAGDGKVFFVSQRGDVSVISAGPDWKVLHRSKLGEEVFATPAIADGRIYLRTQNHLYCFGPVKSD
jgi:outer membrane protein assembly factor BamB